MRYASGDNYSFEISLIGLIAFRRTTPSQTFDKTKLGGSIPLGALFVEQRPSGHPI
jgi:hypothetical protein